MSWSSNVFWRNVCYVCWFWLPLFSLPFQKSIRDVLQLESLCTLRSFSPAFCMGCSWWGWCSGPRRGMGILLCTHLSRLFWTAQEITSAKMMSWSWLLYKPTSLQFCCVCHHFQENKLVRKSGRVFNNEWERCPGRFRTRQQKKVWSVVFLKKRVKRKNRANEIGRKTKKDQEKQKRKGERMQLRKGKIIQSVGEEEGEPERVF